MKKDITPVNEKGNRHGYYEVYWYNGNLWYKGNLINDKLSGYWEFYNRDEELIEKRYYII